MIEAAVRAGSPELAVGACSRLTEMARASGTDWALGSNISWIEARSRTKEFGGIESNDVELIKGIVELISGSFWLTTSAKVLWMAS